MRTDDLAAVLRPLRDYLARVTERADDRARAAGLTVEAGPDGVRRYRDPRLNQLASGPYTGVLAAGSADETGTAWSTPTLTVSASLAGAGWSR